MNPLKDVSYVEITNIDIPSWSLGFLRIENILTKDLISFYNGEYEISER